MNILLVDDDPLLTVILHDYLVDKGHRVSIAYDGVQALQRFEERDFDVAVVDLLMPRMDGLELMEQLQNLAPDLHLIVISGMTEDGGERRQRALAAGAEIIIRKPFGFDDLNRAIAQAAEGAAQPSSAG